MDSPKNVEVWKNTANGTRWYTAFDVQGREISKLVNGGRTFTLTTFERQINQEKAALPELDLFRNGTFSIVKKSEDTRDEEISSKDSRTDQELMEMAMDMIADPKTAGEKLAELSSPQTIHRLLEQLVVEDAPATLIEKTKAAFHEADGGTVAVRRRIVTGA